MLEIGNIAPNFVLKDNNSNNVSLSDFKGKWVILYFYPKDNTSGCTKEACDFTEHKIDYSKLNAEILGVNETAKGKSVHYRENGTKKTVTAEALLVSLGRQGNIANLKL